MTGNFLHDSLLDFDAKEDAPFLIFPGGGGVSRAQFADISARLSARLSALGARKGDRVACQVEKSAEALALCAACVRAGMVFIPLNTAYTPTEVNYFIGDARPAVLVCDEKSREALLPSAREHGATLRTLNADGGGTLTSEISGESPAPPISARPGRPGLRAIHFRHHRQAQRGDFDSPQFRVQRADAGEIVAFFDGRHPPAYAADFSCPRTFHRLVHNAGGGRRNDFCAKI